MDKRIPASAIRRAWLDPALTTEEAARAVGLSRSNLWRRAKLLGLPPRRPGRRDTIVLPRSEAVFTALWTAGVLSAEIARVFGCHPMTVRAWARRLDLARRPLGSRPVVTLRDFVATAHGRRLAALAEAENARMRARGDYLRSPAGAVAARPAEDRP